MSSRPRSICRPGRSKSSLDMNRGAIFGDTSGPTPSAPIVQGGFSHQEERDRLRTCYSTFHGSKVAYHNPAKAIASKASSRRLLAGTNEYAEDLTGQRQPLNASAWRSETKAKFDGKVHRPTSAPSIQRIISNMSNEEPLFGKTYRKVAIQNMNPNQHLTPSVFREKDMYQTSYSFDHRLFSRDEQLAASYWSRERISRPWLQLDPAITTRVNFKLQCREPSSGGENKLYPTEAQLSTLPHYTDPFVAMGNSESRTSFRNPLKTEASFYFEEPNVTKRAIPVHLQKTFVN